MTGLVLRLKPFEKLLVNGAVLQNGARAVRLRVLTERASVLRLRDALAEAKSPAEKIYYVAQLAVAGEADALQARDEILALLDAAEPAAITLTERAALARARTAALLGRSYSVMRAIRPVIADSFGAPQAAG